MSEKSNATPRISSDSGRFRVKKVVRNSRVTLGSQRQSPMSVKGAQ